MEDDNVKKETEVRPFLAAQRRDVLRDLVADRNELVHRNVVTVVGRGMDRGIPKLDGKAGALDGTIAVVSGGDIAAYVPICGAYPGPKIEHPKGKDTKEGKEAKDGKEGKEGKEAKDGKEDKDSSDGFKLGGSEMMDPFSRLGEAERLPFETFNTIARSFPALLKNAIARGGVIF
jgi:hypothetical protein